MNYENMPCPCCGAHLHESDDVVVCPVCATPQHRSCWLETGRCINEEKHDSGFVWSPDNSAAGETDSFNPAYNRSAENDVSVCHICGSENPAGSSHCGSCGALLNADTGAAGEIRRCGYCGFENKADTDICQRCGAPLDLRKVVGMPFGGFGAAGASAGGFAGFDENEMIGSHTAGELALYVRSSVPKYLDKFRKIEEGGVSFNWAAFFFGPFWCFFRKMYSVGIIFIILISAVSLVFASASERLISVITPYQQQLEDRTITQEEMTELTQKMLQISQKPFLIGMGLIMAANFVCALTAYRLYYKKILKDMELLEQQIQDDNMRQMFLYRRGGTSILSAMCGFCTYELAEYVIMYIADFVAERFM